MHTRALRIRACFAAIGLSLTLPLGAQVLMLDFNSALTPSSTNLTNSPYHTVNSGFTDTSWNIQGKGDDASLNWSDGTTATGVYYNALKNGSSGSTVIVKGGWGSSNANADGTAVNTGVYAGNGAGTDGYMFSNTLTDNRAVGIQVFGLAPGTYDIYVTGRNTDYSATAYNMNFFASAGSVEVTATAVSGAGSSGGKLDLSSGFAEETNTFANATDKTASWSFISGDAAASNYARFTVSISAENPYLNLIAMGDSGAAMAQGILNSVQIVSVIPEPSSAALLAGVGMLTVGACRRRRGHR